MPFKALHFQSSLCLFLASIFVTILCLYSITLTFFSLNKLLYTFLKAPGRVNFDIFVQVAFILWATLLPVVNSNQHFPFRVILSIIPLKSHSCSFSHSMLPLQSRIDYSVVPTALYLYHNTYFMLLLYVIMYIINTFIPVLVIFSTL